MPTFDELKQMAIDRCGTTIRCGSLRLMYDRPSRDSSTKEDRVLQFWRWDDQQEKATLLAEAEAQDLHEREFRGSKAHIKIRVMSPHDGACQMCWHDAPQEEVVNVELYGPTGQSVFTLRLCKWHRGFLATCLVQLAAAGPALLDMLQYGEGEPWEEVKKRLGM